MGIEIKSLAFFICAWFYPLVSLFNKHLFRVKYELEECKPTNHRLPTCGSIQLGGKKSVGLPSSFVGVDYPSAGFLGKGVLGAKGLIAMAGSNG